jgi:hypothetical protein
MFLEIYLWIVAFKTLQGLYLCTFDFDFAPTDMERTRGIPVQPSDLWGEQLRQDGSIRLLALGGSNTWMGFITTHFQKYLVNNVSNTSFVLNHGSSGARPDQFIGIRYDFEDGNTNLWPNLVVLDFTVNFTFEVGFETAHRYDLLVRSIKYKYKQRGLGPPDFIIIDLFCTKWLYDDMRDPKYNLTTSFQRKQHIDLLSSLPDIPGYSGGNGFNRGNANTPYVREFALFYGFPVMSWRDVAFPAFIRFFTQETLKPGLLTHYHCNYYNLRCLILV